MLVGGNTYREVRLDLRFDSFSRRGDAGKDLFRPVCPVFHALSVLILPCLKGCVGNAEVFTYTRHLLVESLVLGFRACVDKRGKLLQQLLTVFRRLLPFLLNNLDESAMRCCVGLYNSCVSLKYLFVQALVVGLLIIQILDELVECVLEFSTQRRV